MSGLLFDTALQMSMTSSFSIEKSAGEVIAVVQTAMLADLPFPRLRDAVLAHPTMAEGLGSLFSNVPSRSVQEVTPKSAVG